MFFLDFILPCHDKTASRDPPFYYYHYEIVSASSLIELFNSLADDLP